MKVAMFLFSRSIYFSQLPGFSDAHYKVYLMSAFRERSGRACMQLVRARTMGGRTESSLATFDELWYYIHQISASFSLYCVHMPLLLMCHFVEQHTECVNLLYFVKIRVPLYIVICKVNNVQIEYEIFRDELLYAQ